MNGILVVNKESGMSSHAVCHRIRKLSGVIKSGHAGTLDPMAGGVLVVMLDAATRLAPYLNTAQKRYTAQITFGMRSDTCDIWGEVTQGVKPDFTKERLIAAAASFTGEMMQVPPAYSALKVAGRRLYDYARKGQEVKIQPRPVTVYDISLLAFDGMTATIDVRCSKGTYIRSLCRDFGEVLGCGAVMSALVRTQSGDFELSQAKTLGEIEQALRENMFSDLVLAHDSILAHLPRADVKEQSARILYNGNLLTASNLIQDISAYQPGEEVRIYAEAAFAALGKVCKDGIKPFKLFCQGTHHENHYES